MFHLPSFLPQLFSTNEVNVSAYRFKFIHWVLECFTLLFIKVLYFRFCIFFLENAWFNSEVHYPSRTLQHPTIPHMMNIEWRNSECFHNFYYYYFSIRNSRCKSSIKCTKHVRITKALFGNKKISFVFSDNNGFSSWQWNTDMPF